MSFKPAKKIDYELNIDKEMRRVIKEFTVAFKNGFNIDNVRIQPFNQRFESNFVECNLIINNINKGQINFVRDLIDNINATGTILDGRFDLDNKKEGLQGYYRKGEWKLTIEEI